MPSSSTLLAAVALIADAGLLTFVVRRRAQAHTGSRRWLILTLSAAVVAAALALLPRDAATRSRYDALFPGALTQSALVIAAANLMLVAFCAQMLDYLHAARKGIWIGLGALWWIVTIVALASADSLSIGVQGWYGRLYAPVEWPNALTFTGWLALGTGLMLAALYAFYRAHLPELANRALFGAVIVPPVVIGVGLIASGESAVIEIGWIAQTVGMIGLVYSATAYRVIDIRRTVRQTTAAGLLTLLITPVLFGILVAAQGIDADTRGRYVVLAALALTAAAITIPVQVALGAALNRLFGGTPGRVAKQLRRFSEDIAAIVEMDELAEVTTRTLGGVLNVRRSGLILATESPDSRLQIAPLARGLGEMPDIKGSIATGSPVHTRLVTERAPLLQYDLDFAPTYAATPPGERAFFQQMRMAAYAPVVVQGQLIGIVCCGSRISDDPFTDHDLELLMTIANQAGVALRNARLIDDLRRREGEQADLNKAMSATKEQLEKLDSVKTDFITIASHELRTPLAQIRGYSDIMEAMNEDGMLDQDQIASMTASMRKAADRLEELIAAMLDVSQIDVNAMDLRFGPVALEGLMRTAIEPLTEAIRSRKLMLSARGLRDLPPIQADQQRLVQAFRNIVLNAIKFTPDGGRIDITGELRDTEVIITIRDSGIGIDPANKELIFEKFFRAQDPSLHSTGATKFMGAGPGLGLTIARGVVMAHGGRIWAESPGYGPETFPGSAFFIALPLRPPDDARHIRTLESTVSLSVRAFRNVVRGEAAPPAAPDSSEPTLPRPPVRLRDS